MEWQIALHMICKVDSTESSWSVDDNNNNNGYF